MKIPSVSKQPLAYAAPTRTCRALETREGLLTQPLLDQLGINAGLVFDAERMKTDGIHAIYKGTNDVGQKVVVKDNSSIVNLAGGLGPLVQGVTGVLYPGNGRLQNINDILLRQVFRNNVDCPVSTAREAVFRDPGTGHVHFGIQEAWVPGMGSVKDSDAPPLSNPMQAARGLVYSCLLMGNFDSTWREGNNTEISADGRMSDGTVVSKGEYMVSDLGWAGQRGNSVLTLPFGSLQLTHSLSKEDIQAAVDEVVHLSDEEIRGWIDTAGQETITGWNDDLCDFYTVALTHNRDALAKHVQDNPDWITQRPDAFLRGRFEFGGQLLFAPSVVSSKYANMASSGVLRHITTHKAMTRTLRDALKSAPYPSITAALSATH